MNTYIYQICICIYLYMCTSAAAASFWASAAWSILFAASFVAVLSAQHSQKLTLQSKLTHLYLLLPGVWWLILLQHICVYKHMYINFDMYENATRSGLVYIYHIYMYVNIYVHVSEIVYPQRHFDYADIHVYVCVDVH